MKKYIDVAKLIAEIERRIDSWSIRGENSPVGQGKDTCVSRVTELTDLLSFIDSLQAEQPVLPGIEDPGIPGKDFIPVEWVDACEMYGKWKIVKQEQPEVDLEKFAEKIDAYKARHGYPESISVNGAMAFMARMFYQHPNAARQWYENLPKATMDDNARKEG